jgi:hypothetical protein
LYDYTKIHILPHVLEEGQDRQRNIIQSEDDAPHKQNFYFDVYYSVADYAV